MSKKQADHLNNNVNSLPEDNDEEMTFEDVGLPVSWNNHWQFQSPYESYVGAAANFISYNSSYVLLERAMGGGNKLLFIPDPDTDAKLEYRKFVSRETTFTNPPEEYSEILDKYLPQRFSFRGRQHVGPMLRAACLHLGRGQSRGLFV